MIADRLDEGDTDDPDSLMREAVLPAALDILADGPPWTRGDLARVEEAVTAALQAERANVPSVGLSVRLSNDRTVHDLNSTYRGQDKPTNVLSFASYTAAEVRAVLDGFDTAAPTAGQPVFLGDLIVASGVLAAEAKDQGKDRRDHLAHLIVHGVLHLLGYDHQSEDEATQMEAREHQILAPLGVDQPYKERESGTDTPSANGL